VPSCVPDCGADGGGDCPLQNVETDIRPIIAEAYAMTRPRQLVYFKVDSASCPCPANNSVTPGKLRGGHLPAPSTSVLAANP